MNKETIDEAKCWLLNNMNVIPEDVFTALNKALEHAEKTILET
jgi:hypothetical protein